MFLVELNLHDFSFSSLMVCLEMWQPSLAKKAVYYLDKPFFLILFVSF